MKIRTISFTIFFTLFLVGSIVVSLRMNVFDIFKRDGTARDLTHNEQVYFQKRDFSSLFEIAWNHYADGQLTRAEGLVNKILYEERWDLDEELEANCHYLKAVIQYSRNDYPEAMHSVFLAGKIFMTLDEPKNNCKVNLLAAQIHIELGDLALATTMLEAATTIAEEQGYGLGPFYTVKSRIAFARADWMSAYGHSELSYEAFVLAEDDGGKADALSDMGFFLMLQGELEKGLQKAYEAETLIKEIRDDERYYFNLINYVLFERCSGRPAGGPDQHPRQKTPLSEIRPRLEDEGYEKMRWYLDFVMTHNCTVADDVNREAEEPPSSEPD